MTNVIEVSQLSKKFGEQEVLNNVTLSIKKGQIYGLLGANGTGKTTLMKIMLGLLKPTEGSVKILGSEVSKGNPSILSKVGNIIEIPVFYESLTVEENLNIHCDYLNENYKKDISKILEIVGLEGSLYKKVKELSLGMRQRLAIGRAILCEPELLILDEPINGLDPKGIVDIREILTRLNKERNLSIIISSHIISEMVKLADTIGIIHNGRLVEEITKGGIDKEDFNLENHFLKILSS
ncbi:ATP-binding cassette domain-containing protein [Gottfriedia acidiceleris]|uniref:ABC transporter ATP-binding protein n=1 Tax=Gottfriedia acidiceleris TaxID=371036 RepID=UPI002F26C00E